tara:strand:+ start:134 stop:580 length:447 start_codon:yes stop_codon:yes gene_type:complete
MEIFLFIIFFATCCVAASTGMLFPTGEWYKSLKKPSWTPPDWLFPIAWTIFYTSLAFSGSRIALIDNNGLAIGFWALHLCINTLWTPVFFGLKKIKIGMFVMILLWISTVFLIFFTFQLDLIAGWVILPYIVWVSYAAALNFSLLLKN